MLVDSHCHLDFPDFDADRDALLERARAAGVGTIVTISTRVRRFPQIQAIVERYDEVYCSVGTHPMNAAEEPDITTEELVAIARHPKVVAIGEAGLDYHYTAETAELQRLSFIRQIAAARITGLPLVIHARDADQDIGDVLEAEMGKGPFPAILHCYASGAELACRGLALGCYISFSGIVTFRNSKDLQAIAASVPMERLLVETDAPYLAPVPYRGKRNEPSYVVETNRVLADLKGVTAEAMAVQTTDNFFRLFNKVPRP